MAFVGRQLIPAPHGQLEAIYRPETDRAERVALVLHPHPLYGGTMHNKVVYRIAKALDGAGIVTLRFNFRGVEGSSGGYDQGRGEAEDAGVALEWLLAQQSAAREVLIAGFSFGASIGLRFSAAPMRFTRPAPCLAADSKETYCGLLGMSEAEFDDLSASGALS